GFMLRKLPRQDEPLPCRSLNPFRHLCSQLERLDGRTVSLWQDPPALVPCTASVAAAVATPPHFGHLPAFPIRSRLWSFRDSSALGSSCLSAGVLATMASADSLPLSRQGLPE